MGKICPWMERSCCPAAGSERPANGCKPWIRPDREREKGLERRGRWSRRCWFERGCGAGQRTSGGVVFVRPWEESSRPHFGRTGRGRAARVDSEQGRPERGGRQRAGKGAALGDALGVRCDPRGVAAYELSRGLEVRRRRQEEMGWGTEGSGQWPLALNFLFSMWRWQEETTSMRLQR